LRGEASRQEAPLMTEPDEDGHRVKRPPPRAVTPAYLERAALAYLERFASSAQNLARVLKRKVERRCRLRAEDPAPFVALIDDVVARAVRGGLVDDRRYAEGRVASLRRRGGSARGIGAKLAAKGVARETVAAVLLAAEDDELAACARACPRQAARAVPDRRPCRVSREGPSRASPGRIRVRRRARRRR
jgi:regulatory protein